eukprot:RCo049657
MQLEVHQRPVHGPHGGLKPLLSCLDVLQLHSKHLGVLLLLGKLLHEELDGLGAHRLPGHLRGLADALQHLLHRLLEVSWPPLLPSQPWEQIKGHGQLQAWVGRVVTKPAAVLEYQKRSKHGRVRHPLGGVRRHRGLSQHGDHLVSVGLNGEAAGLPSEHQDVVQQEQGVPGVGVQKGQLDQPLEHLWGAGRGVVQVVRPASQPAKQTAHEGHSGLGLIRYAVQNEDDHVNGGVPRQLFQNVQVSWVVHKQQHPPKGAEVVAVARAQIQLVRPGRDYIAFGGNRAFAAKVVAGGWPSTQRDVRSATCTTKLQPPAPRGRATGCGGVLLGGMAAAHSSSRSFAHALGRHLGNVRSVEVKHIEDLRAKPSQNRSSPQSRD